MNVSALVLGFVLAVAITGGAYAAGSPPLTNLGAKPGVISAMMQQRAQPQQQKVQQQNVSIIWRQPR